MAQHDGVIDNNTGALVRADINNALAALLSNSSGATAPATTYAYQFWVDTSAGAVMKIRNGANSAWITIGDATIANFGALLLTGGTLTGQLGIKNAATLAALDLFFSGDTDTGAYSSGANLLDLVAGGASLLRVDGVLGLIKLLGTAGFFAPSGTTAQRPTGVNGIIRYNSDTGAFEGYKSGAWGSLGASTITPTVATKTNSNSPITLAIGDNGTIFDCDVTSGNIQFNLPSPGTVGSGFNFTILDSKGLFSTVPGFYAFLVPNATELIQGLNANFNMQATWGSYEVYTDGTNWFIK